MQQKTETNKCTDTNLKEEMVNIGRGIVTPSFNQDNRNKIEPVNMLEAGVLVSGEVEWN